MADISKLSRLINGLERQVDLSTNALVVGSLKVGSVSPTELTKAILDKLILIQTAADSDGTFDTRYTKISDLASTANVKGASLVGIEDSANNFTATTVEGALAELFAAAGSGAASDVTFNNTASGLTATNVQDAIDEVEGRVDATESVANAAIPASQKGAANGVAELDADGFVPVTQIPPAALERLVIVADQTARFALTTATVQNGDTVKQTDTNVMYFVKDDTNLDSAAGYEIYSAGTASAVAWSGVTGTPTTLAGYGITDYASAAKAAAVANSITDGITDVAPSQNAVFDALALKAPIASPTFTGTVSGITKSMVGLGNADDTADANKAVASASALKEFAEIAGESFSATTVYAVRYGQDAETASAIYKADLDATSVDNFNVIGLVLTVGALVATDPMPVITKAGLFTATGSSFTVGKPVFLSTSGALTSTAPTTANHAVVRVGIAKSATVVDVNIQVVGVN